MKTIDAIDFQKNEAQNLRLQNLASDISSPVNGLIYYSSAGTDHIRAYIDGTWEDIPRMSDVTSSGISSTLIDAKGDLLVGTADDAIDNLTVGADGTVLVAASGQTTGLQWRTLTEADINLGTTDRLVGRDTAGAGVAEELTVGGGIEFTGSGGIQRSAITGDIDISAGSGTAAIAAGVIVNADINASAGIVVTKLASSATDRLFGRDTASAGAGEEITVGGGIEFTGSGGIQRSALTGDITATAGSGTTAIAAGVIVDADVNASAAIAATKLAFTPAQGISATTVQAAIEEAVTDLTALVNTGLQGQKFKDLVDAATTGVLPNTPTYSSGAGTLTAGSNAAFPTIDGVAAAVGQDYLVKDQVSTFQNGIYTLTTLGSGAAAWVLTRRSDADTATELQDAAVLVEAGTTNGGSIFTQVNAIADLTSATQSWFETNRNEVYTADGTTLTLSANQFSIATGGISNTHINASAAIAYSKLALSNSVVNADIAAGAAIAYSKLALTGSIVNADIGAAAAIAYSKLNLTGSIVNADINASAAIAYSKLALASSITAADVNGTGVASGSGTVRVARSFTQAITGGATSEVITHPLGTRSVVASLVNPSTPWDHVMATFESTSTTTLTIRSSANLPAGYLVTIVG